ncbi:hypothetical protein [[Ruminococcus] torques]|nr:hypothetical protein [[Ruminococcus] torques]MEE0688287.1 hypothetical protein [[Ruminococcus] torques]
MKAWYTDRIEMDRTEERLNGIRKKYMQHRRCAGYAGSRLTSD